MNSVKLETIETTPLTAEQIEMERVATLIETADRRRQNLDDFPIGSFIELPYGMKATLHNVNNHLVRTALRGMARPTSFRFRMGRIAARDLGLLPEENTNICSTPVKDLCGIPLIINLQEHGLRLYKVSEA